MRILNATTGATEATGATNKPIDKLAFKFTNVENEGLDNWASITLEVVRNTGNVGIDKTPINDLKMQNLAELAAQMTDGYYKQTYATLDGASKLSIVECVIPLAAFGILMEKDEEIRFTLKGLDTGDTVSVYGLENPVVSRSMHNYQKLDIINDREKSFEIKQAEVILIPKTGLTEIQLTHSNGRTYKLLPEELEFQAMYHNSATVYRSDNATISYAATESNYVIDVIDHTEINVKCTADTYLIVADTK